jgi:SPP1 family predicted phage head-tail adaptor
MGIGASNLDRRLTIERATTLGTDGLGHPILAWKELATVACMVRPVSDGERWRAGEIAAQITTRFTIRHGAGVTPTDRLVFEGRLFNVTGVKEVADAGRRRFVEITASARAE